MKRCLLIFLALCTTFLTRAQDFEKTAARQLVIKHKTDIGLSENDASNFIVSSAYYDKSDNIQRVYLLQGYKGLPVYNQMIVLAFRNDKLISKSGRFINNIDSVAGFKQATPSLIATDAIRAAFREAKVIVPGSMPPVEITENGRKTNYGTVTGVTENVITELLWVPTEQGKKISLQLAWQVQVAPKGTQDWWQIRIDASNGQLINKSNLTVYESTGKQTPDYVTARRTERIQDKFPAGKFFAPPTVTTASYLVVPFPYESPIHQAPTVVNQPWLNAGAGNAATTDGWHFDGTNNYTITRGNNVYAYLDIDNTNAPNTGNNLSATSTTPDPSLTFNFTPNFTQDPNTTTNKNFAITNLFYWNNLMHDVSYQYGFTEPAGNFQTDNIGRGGNGNDYVQAEGQDGGGTNNANFATPADGGRPRMQMYLFDAVSSITFHVNTPPVVAGNYTAVESGFSTANKLSAVGPVTGQVIYFNDDAGGTTHFACGTAANVLTGKIAMIVRGTCNFTAKVLTAQNAGAIAVIMVNNAAGAPIVMGGTDNTITIPAVMISDVDGATLAAQLANNLNVTLSGSAGQRLDGDLDAGVMCHEYTHGISNRLTGGPANTSCLQNAEQGGEGWSDYLGLMMTTNWATATVNDGPLARPIGTYVEGQSTTGSGIRNYPYSTNLAINPLTYANMGVGTIGTEVHNIGEIWCMAAWEMTWAIIQQQNSINTNLYNYSPTVTGGNSIALKLVLEGMKLQPCSPGYIDARNAILTADNNLYGGSHQCAIWTAFAKRGMGYSALQGSSFSATDQTAASDLPPAPTITGQPVNASVTAGSNATFTATATAPINGAYIYYNWQVSTDGGTTWNNVSPAVTTASLTLTAVTVSMNGYKYRCVLTQGCATTTSSVATLTVSVPTGFSFTSPAPATTACPAPAFMDIVLGTNSIGSFTNPITVSAGTAPAGTTVSFIPSATVTPGNSVTVRLTGTNTLVAGSYVITITGTASGAVNQTRDLTYTITAGSGPVITSQPVNQAICAGSNTSFTITSATATGFQWQVSTDGGTTYNSVPNTGVYSGATTATLNITSATAVLNNNRYRCVAVTLCGSTTSTAAILTVNTAPAITGQPTSAAVCTGANQTFTAATTGSSLTYQWYISTDGGTTFNVLPNAGVYSGATLGSLTITGVTAGLNNNQYRCVITGICPVSPITSNTATLTVITSLNITGQPADVVTCAGTNTSFTVTAVGASTYQWQLSTDGGVTYNTVTNGGIYTGATTATLNLTGVTTAISGNRYRCVLTSTCGNATSTGALLTVNSLPAITAQPSDITLCAGGNNTFSITATGSGITYQWQVSTNGCAGTWNNIPGATSSSYTLTGITAGQTNTGYRCIVTGVCSPAVTSNCAVLTVVTSVTIASQPVSTTVCEGSNASFTITGTGTGIIYQWQVSTDGGVTYTNVTNNTVYSGATTATLNITATTFSLNNNRYRCQLSNSTCTTPGISNAAILTVNTLPVISTNPQSATICIGGSNTFSTTAAGTGITYQWQISTPAVPAFTNIAGATAATYTVSGAVIGQNGNQYRVVVSGACTPAATSAAATLTVIAPVAVATQPAVTVELCSGSNATFSVVGTSTQTIVYQWQVSTDGGTTWTSIPGATASTYTATAITTALSNNKYRVQMSNATCLAPTVSNPASLTVHQLPTVGLTATSTSLSPGQISTLTGTPSPSTGGVLTTTWTYNSSPLTVVNNTYVANVEKIGTYQVSIAETWPSSLVCSNQSQLVTIAAPASSRLFIFPSPNNGTFNVAYYNSAGGSTSRSVTVYDSRGAKVYYNYFAITGPYTLLKVELKTVPQKGVYYVVVGDAAGKVLAEDKILVAQ